MAKQIQYVGQVVTPGIALGPAVLLKRGMRPVHRRVIDENSVVNELAALEKAIILTKRDIEAQRKRATRVLGEIVARIFDAHLLILDDEITFGQIKDEINEELFSAEYALWKTFDKIARNFSSQKEDIFRDRAQDVKDVSRRILMHLSGRKADVSFEINKASILIADELGPSDVLQIDPERIIGVATDVGGSTSHTAILTRVLGVPSVVGLRDITSKAQNGDMVALNGNSGKLILCPSKKVIARYREKETTYREYVDSLKDINHLPAITLDNHKVEIAANIELPNEVKKVKRYGAEGIGLLRTEYLFIAKGKVPSENEQVHEYRKLAETLSPHPVIIRTFDLGGDKAFPGSGIPPEANPFLGWRAIRVGLDRPEMLKTQFRAILKASAFGNVKLLLPMICDLSELKSARKIYKQARLELENENESFSPNIEVGMMVEVPSAALLASQFAPFVDFFSIGTNDLTQFTLAVDRGNQQVGHLYTPYHPAVLKLINETVQAGHNAGKWVGLCGEIAGDPLATMLLVGLGIDELSASPAAIPEIKKLIRSMSKPEAEKIAQKCLNARSAAEVYKYLSRTMRKKFAELPIWFGRSR
ncbi:MAG: phosphoenolpyruvate--protein phosphotransferase [Candidatus Electryonea clarkiae]|nr:phosphoenolpyruvate--protein phosphotransferase [Candidatus Electryonea clarkiae]MDP8286892.1 phosphoenolpyruvate--protein phosphotransferase [Candidatus Electryonea clarkiae]